MKPKAHRILRHFRIPNLLIMGLFVFLLHLQFKSWVDAPLDLLSILLLIFSMWLIAAAGYLLNDYYDFREDLINKGYSINSRFSRTYIIRLYSVLTVCGLGLSAYLSIVLQRYGILYCSLLATGFLFLYAYQFKRLYYIKNLWISVLMTFPVIYWYLAEAYGNRSFTPSENYTFLITGYLLLFSFLLNLIREILKDIIDAPGDREAGVKTIPLVFGQKFTRHLLIFLFLFSGIIRNYKPVQLFRDQSV